MRARVAPLVWCVLVAGSPAALAQTPAPPPRPKIGIALGGGVARGIAHIGVLQWLEEHHVPVDLVAGTSAGALIGGAYATGMTPADLRALMASIDWDNLFQSDAPYALKDFRRKEDAREYPAYFEFGLRKGLRAASSLSSGEQVDLLLSRLTQRYYDLRSFDDLPIPFRCVATDLRAEEPVVLSDGPLAEAMRASMAFPGLFAPVVRGDRVLVDGGVLDNVPADVVRAMGADIVIAVDVGASTPLEPGVFPAIVVMSRTLDVLMDRNAKQALEAADILFKPDIKDIAAMDWLRYVEIIERGYRAAAAVPRLATLSVDEATWTAHLAARSARRITADPIPTLLTVSGAMPGERDRIHARLAHHLGYPLDAIAIGRDLTAITGSARYDTVTYQLIGRPEGIELAVKATPKSYGPPFLRFGFDLTNTMSTVLAVGVRGRLTAFDVAGYGSELRLDAMVGTGFGLATELYRPIGKSRLFVAPRAGLQWSDQGLFYDSHQLADYRTDRAFFGADVGVAINRHSEWRVGYTYGRATASVSTGNPDLPRFTGPESLARMQFIYEGQDAVVVPSRGLRVEAVLTRVLQGIEPDTGTPSNLETGVRTMGEIRSSAFVPIRKRHRFMASFSGGTSFGAPNDSYYDFTLGGPNRLRAYDLGEFRGLNYLLGSVAYLHNLGRLPDFLGGPIYVAGAVETGCTFADLKSARARTALSTGLVMDTLVGPVSLTAGVSVDGHYRVYVNVGRLFR
jgi:NTE family protein